MGTRYSDIVIVGAGASHGARPHLPRDARPPLGKDLATYVERWIAGNRDWARETAPRLGTRASFGQLHRQGLTEAATLRAFLGTARRLNEDGRGFERAMDQIVDDRDDAAFSLPLINRIVAASLLTGAGCNFAAQPDQYDRLLRDYCSMESRVTSILLISFNYDLLLEEAIARLLAGDAEDIESAVEYVGLGLPAPSKAGPRGRVLKPHGSSNWSDSWGGSGSQTNPDRPESRMSSSELGFDHGENYVPPGGRCNAADHLRYGDMPLAMAQYSRGKPVATNSSVIDRVRQQTIADIQGSGNARVTVIGLFPPRDQHDDPLLHMLFKTLQRHQGPTHFVNPSDRECGEAARYGFETHQKAFDEFLDEQTARRL